MSIDFYRNLPAARSLAEVFREAEQRPVPDDWWVVITDVIGSTVAIEAGRYKDVNVAGGLAVIAVSNAFETMAFPFVFGGDGVTILIPDQARELASDLLYDTRRKVRELFDLELRVGMVSAREIRAAGHDLHVAKLHISQYYEQAILRGTGVDYAEALVKSKETDAYLIKEQIDPSRQADFSGFTCRWKDIKSPRGETISLIIKPRHENASAAERDNLYREILEAIPRTFGDEEEHHPLNENNLILTTDSEFLGREARALTGRKSGPWYFIKLLLLKIEAWGSRFAVRFRIPWRTYWYKVADLKKYQIASSDFKKYDGTLKMVIAGAPDQRRELERYLSNLRESGRIFYGIHVSDRALMTCLLHEGSEREVHFVDAADGGYALAAKQLKAQIREAAGPSTSPDPGPDPANLRRHRSDFEE